MPAELTATAPDLWASARTPKPRPWPLDALLRAAGIKTTTELAKRLRVSGTTIKDAAARQLTDERADSWAIRLGLHPAEVWPDWWAYDPEHP